MPLSVQRLFSRPRVRALAVPVLTVLLLVGTGLTPWYRGATPTVLVLLLLAVSLVTAGRLLRRHAVRSAAGESARVAVTRPILELVLQLAPVLLLTVAFPAAVSRISTAQVGGVPLTTVLLASSLTVPWLSMAVCLPLYRGIGHLLPATDARPIRSRLAEVLPTTFLQTAPAVLVFAVPVALVMRWSVPALLAYVVLCLLHAAFAQSLVLANVTRDRILWASAWAAYAAVLLLVPQAWFLPPVAGILTQLVPLRHEVRRMRRPARLEHADVAVDVVRGLLAGAVLWAHLLFLFLRTRGDFSVDALFLAILPAVVAYNYYFVRLAPTFDDAVLRFRDAMEHEPHARLHERSRLLAAVVGGSVRRTGLVGALLGFGVTVALGSQRDVSIAFVAAVAVASWLFLMTTLLCYKLDYIGQRREADVLNGAHLVVSALAFLVLPPGPLVYLGLIAAELVVFAVALQRSLGHWRTSEYALFWRHATAW